jgi:hypothetical protein
MGLSTEEKVLLDHLLEKQKEAKATEPPKVAGGKKLYVVKALDRSSSMSPYKAVTIETYNESLDALRGSTVETYVTLIEFNASVSAGKVQPLGQVKGLTHNSYNPNGMTAIYDAIGYAFELADKVEWDGNTSFLLEVFTDGEENSSTKYTQHTIKEIIDMRKRSGQWTVTVMGPHGSVNLFRNLGVEVGNIATFNVSSEHSRGLAKSALRKSTANYVSTVNAAVGSVQLDTAYSSVIGSNSVDDLDPAKQPAAK